MRRRDLFELLLPGFSFFLARAFMPSQGNLHETREPRDGFQRPHSSSLESQTRTGVDLRNPPQERIG